MWRRHRRKGEVLSVVERGWRGARDCSLTLNEMAIPVTHLIKGYLSRELRAMVQPYPHIQIVSVPRPLFRIGLWWVLVGRTLTGRLRVVLIDHERTLREASWWCRLWGVTPVTIHETDDGYTLEANKRPVALAAVFNANDAHADRPRL